MDHRVVDRGEYREKMELESNAGCAVGVFSVALLPALIKLMKKSNT